MNENFGFRFESEREDGQREPKHSLNSIYTVRFGEPGTDCDPGSISYRNITIHPFRNRTKHN
jgi:hypothetical protein